MRASLPAFLSPTATGAWLVAACLVVTLPARGQDPAPEGPGDQDVPGESALVVAAAEAAAAAEDEAADEDGDEKDGAEETATEEADTEEAVAEETGAEETATEEADTEEAVAEETGTEETATEEADTEEAVAEETGAEETATEEADTEEAVAQETAAEETAADAAVAQETVTEETAVEDAAAEGDELVHAERVGAADDDKAWGVSANAGTSTSMAMFHPTPFVRSYGRSLSLSLGASGRYRLTEQLSATAGLGAAYNLVNPKDLSGRRFWLSDPNVGISHSSLFKDEQYTGVNVTGGLGASVGLSPSSRYHNRIGSLSGSLSAGRSFVDGRLSLGWSLNGGAVFSRYSSPIVRKESNDGLDMALARADGSELLAGRYNLVAGNAQIGSLGTTLSASFRAMEGLTASASVGVSRSLRYCPPIDHLSSDAVDSNGDRIVRQGGVCGSDGMTGSFGASYNLGDGYVLAGSFSSGQPIFAYRGTDLTEENRTLRFPWWDPDLHMTSFALRVSKSF